MSIIRRQCLFVCIAAAVCADVTVSGAQYTLTTLATFNGTNGDSPVSGLIADASGNLYGTTQLGGAHNAGTVFEVAAGTHALSTLATFGTDGSHPSAGLRADGSSNFYGTTSHGGANLQGTVFKVAAGTHALSTLASFNGTNGASPESGLIADASGNLYGTTYQGGDVTLNNGAGFGTVYEVAAGTLTLTDLVTFNGTNGASPNSGLIADASGNLYGTTNQGGANNDGTVFEVAAGTHAITTLATFNGTNGALPFCSLIADSSGNLYGTTAFGGGRGTVFELAAGTHTLTTLATFNDTNGAVPFSGLIRDASGNLFGTTVYGGDLTLNNGSGFGTVFKVAAGTHVITTLATFNGANGSGPVAELLADASGNLYGTTRFGGASDKGTVFELSPLPGDYNGNGVVDTADYTVWRDGLGTKYAQADYDVWRSHFGTHAGSGAGASATVPEPASAWLLIVGAAAGTWRRRIASRVPTTQ